MAGIRKSARLALKGEAAAAKPDEANDDENPKPNRNSNKSGEFLVGRAYTREMQRAVQPATPRPKRAYEFLCITGEQGEENHAAGIHTLKYRMRWLGYEEETWDSGFGCTL